MAGIVDKLGRVLTGEQEVKAEITINTESLIRAMIIIVLTATLILVIDQGIRQKL